jgi:SulP family sulfate permease
MGLANLVVPLLGGMPVCHGAGGLAAHYRFGARTVGANLMIGALLLVLGLLFGPHAASLLSVIPLSVLGALLVFSGIQLSLMVLDVRRRRDLFVVLAMLIVALASNLAVGFVVGIALAYALRHPRLGI